MEPQELLKEIDRQLETVAVGVDWLTATASDSFMASKIWEYASKLAYEIEAAGNFARRWNWRGYSGYTMQGLRYGHRSDGVICIVSGGLAQDCFYDLMRYCDNVSRVDLALTYTLNQPIPDVALTYYEYLVKGEGSEHPQAVKTISLIQNSQGGQTLYIGSRRSDQYGRVYDKGRESTTDIEVGKIWRYEVEFKSKRALAVANKLHDDSVVRPGELNPRLERTIKRWFTDRLVVLSDDLWGSTYLVEREAVISDVSRTLAWFSAQVRPSVERLKVKGVSLATIKESLGLPPGYVDNLTNTSQGAIFRWDYAQHNQSTSQIL